ncbi:hypothetical protein BDZ97DRAFT_2056119 [Flammula alnicola]|nr:hypothetical protein BDZ97DRAFT_2056119 [Flammula alnicola]
MANVCHHVPLALSTFSMLSTMEFHAFWRELPNYNPIAVTTLTPGLDHAAEAALLFESGAGADFDAHDDEVDCDEEEGNKESESAGDEPEDVEGEKEKDDEDEDPLTDWAPSLPSSKSKPLPSTDLLLSKPSVKPIHPKATAAPIRSKATAEVKQGKLGGRDAGLAKAHSAAATGKQGPKTQLERFNENRTNETVRLSRKHEMDHELRMENAKTKRYKYEYKYGAPQRVAEAQLQAAEAEHLTRIEELKLQIKLARIQHLGASSVSSATTTNTFHSSTDSSRNDRIPEEWTGIRRNGPESTGMDSIPQES